MNGCELVIVPHNLTYKLQPLHICINQQTKNFISSQFNSWYGERASDHFRRDITTDDVKVLLKMADLKSLACTMDHLHVQLFKRTVPIDHKKI